LGFASSRVFGLRLGFLNRDDRKAARMFDLQGVNPMLCYAIGITVGVFIGYVIGRMRGASEAHHTSSRWIENLKG
jgi:hypothetical protein